MQNGNIFIILCLFFNQRYNIFYLVHAVPMRTIVDVRDKSPKSSSEEGIRYSPVFQQNQTKASKTNKKARGGSKGQDKSHEEQLEKERERARIFRKENPDYVKSKNREAYIRRKNDPEKRARDEAYRIKYRSTHKKEHSERHTIYMRRWRQKKAQRQQQQQQSIGIIRPQKKRKERDISDEDTTDIGQSPKSPQPRIIARLKLPSETIKEFYGVNPPTS
jgi:hypothetical protein